MNNHYAPRSFKIMPTAVKNIIIINALFYLATLVLGYKFNIDLINSLGLHYFSSEAFQPYQFVTYMFMHSTNFNHIFFNMFALWMFGSALENYWGAKRFLIYYFVTGIGASLIHYIVMFTELQPTLAAIDFVINNPSAINIKDFFASPNFVISSTEIQQSFIEFQNSYNHAIGNNPNEARQLAIDFLNQYRTLFLNAPVMVGASGAVFGLLLAFGMTFPNTLIYIYFFIPLKAKYFVIIYGVLEIFFGISGRQSDVAHFAHLGGMLFGILLILYWRNKNKKRFL